MTISDERQCRAIRAKQDAWMKSEHLNEMQEYCNKMGYSEEMLAEAIDAVFEEDIHKVITRSKR